MAGVDIGVPRAPFRSLTAEQESRLEVLMRDLGVLSREAAPAIG